VHLRTFAFLLVIALSPLGQAATTTVTAVHATDVREGEASFDVRSAVFRELLSPLPYDRFETAMQTEIELARETKAQVRLNARYTLGVSDTEAQPDGHVKCVVRVYGSPSDGREPVKLLEMTVRLAPDKPVMIRGLRMDEGEIVIFLNLD
jgi:hypothetical protein